MSFHPSPSYSERPLKGPLFIVLHDSVSPSIGSLRNTMLSEAARVSYHYGISKGGALEQYVKEEHIAWHAGRSRYLHHATFHEEFNQFSLGIALVGMNTVDEVYPEAQMKVLRELVTHLMRKYKLAPNRILRHADISLDRGKTDPRSLDMAEFRASVTPPYRLPAYHPDTNAQLGEVTVFERVKVYPTWLKDKSQHSQSLERG
jgi:N-acetylmuramoyl-L-alanine amidase